MCIRDRLSSAFCFLLVDVCFSVFHLPAECLFRWFLYAKLLPVVVTSVCTFSPIDVSALSFNSNDVDVLSVASVAVLLYSVVVSAFPPPHLVSAGGHHRLCCRF